MSLSGLVIPRYWDIFCSSGAVARALVTVGVRQPEVMPLISVRTQWEASSGGRGVLKRF